MERLEFLADVKPRLCGGIVSGCGRAGVRSSIRRLLIALVRPCSLFVALACVAATVRASHLLGDLPVLVNQVKHLTRSCSHGAGSQRRPVAGLDGRPNSPFWGATSHPCDCVGKKSAVFRV